MNEASKVDRAIADRMMGDKKMKTRLKYFWQIVFCLTVLLGSVLARLADGAEPKPMNIVLFLIDDLGCAILAAREVLTTKRRTSIVWRKKACDLRMRMRPARFAPRLVRRS